MMAVKCPICDFASKLWRDGVENDDSTLKNEAKKLFARKRYYSPVLVRGNESEGVKIWAYGKTAYETLLGYVLILTMVILQIQKQEPTLS